MTQTSFITAPIVPVCSICKFEKVLKVHGGPFKRFALQPPHHHNVAELSFVLFNIASYSPSTMVQQNYKYPKEEL